MFKATVIALLGMIVFGQPAAAFDADTMSKAGTLVAEAKMDGVKTQIKNTLESANAAYRALAKGPSEEAIQAVRKAIRAIESLAPALKGLSPDELGQVKAEVKRCLDMMGFAVARLAGFDGHEELLREMAESMRPVFDLI